MDYINHYQAEARNDRIHRFATAIGVDEVQLRTLMERGVTEGNINEFGMFDKLKKTIDKASPKSFWINDQRSQLNPLKSWQVLTLFCASIFQTRWFKDNACGKQEIIAPSQNDRPK